MRDYRRGLKDAMSVADDERADALWHLALSRGVGI
jgi:hypothetical protein